MTGISDGNLVLRRECRQQRCGVQAFWEWSCFSIPFLRVSWTNFASNVSNPHGRVNVSSIMFDCKAPLGYMFTRCRGDFCRRDTCEILGFDTKDICLGTTNIDAPLSQAVKSAFCDRLEVKQSCVWAALVLFRNGLSLIVTSRCTRMVQYLWQYLTMSRTYTTRRVAMKLSMKGRARSMTSITLQSMVHQHNDDLLVLPQYGKQEQIETSRPLSTRMWKIEYSDTVALDRQNVTRHQLNNLLSKMNDCEFATRISDGTSYWC